MRTRRSDETAAKLTANLPFEAMAFDNIQINGVPEPASCSLLGLAGLLLLTTRRRAVRG